MKEKISETAGKLWKALREEEEINVTQLPKVVREKTTVVYQALGWLAREDKVVYHTKGTKTFVSLTETERNI